MVATAALVFGAVNTSPKAGLTAVTAGAVARSMSLRDTNVADLTDYHYKPGWKAKNGEPGRGADQHGANGADIIMRVPVGTVVIDRETEETGG